MTLSTILAHSFCTQSMTGLSTIYKKDNKLYEIFYSNSIPALTSATSFLLNYLWPCLSFCDLQHNGSFIQADIKALLKLINILTFIICFLPFNITGGNLFCLTVIILKQSTYSKNFEGIKFEMKRVTQKPNLVFNQVMFLVCNFKR